MWHRYVCKFSSCPTDSCGFDMLNLHDWLWTSMAHLLLQNVKCACASCGAQWSACVVCSLCSHNCPWEAESRSVWRPVFLAEITNIETQSSFDCSCCQWNAYMKCIDLCMWNWRKTCIIFYFSTGDFYASAPEGYWRYYVFGLFVHPSSIGTPQILLARFKGNLWVDCVHTFPGYMRCRCAD